MKIQSSLKISIISKISVVAYLLYLQFYTSAATNPDTQYSTSEREALKKLKLSVLNLLYEDYQHLDSYLIHYLRQKDLNVNHTTKLLQENFKWRKVHKVDSILQEKGMIDLEKYFPFSTDGVDKEGRPILSYSIQKWDVRRFVLAGKVEEYRRYQIYVVEKVNRKVYDLALAGKDVSQYNILIDMGGFNARQHGCFLCLQLLTEFLSITNAHYPNTAYQAIVINAPRAFQLVVNVVKSFFTPEHQNMINVYGYDKTEWRRHLENSFDDNQLPIAFGGTREFKLPL